MNGTIFKLGGLVIAANLLSASPAGSVELHYLPPERIQGSVRYLTGGVGPDETAAMRTAEARYPLSLEFIHKARPREYLADVRVTIKNHAGRNALATNSEGPFLLANLPNGRYTVWAEENGKIKVRHVSIRANQHERLTFEW